MNNKVQNKQTDIGALTKEYKEAGNHNKPNYIGYYVIGGLAMAGLAFWTWREIRQFRANKSDKKSFEDGTPQTLAKQIKMAFENDGYFGTDTKALRVIMQKIKSKAELEQVRKEYQKQFGSQLYHDMMKELQSTEYAEMLQIMEGKPDKPGGAITVKQYLAWAKRLKAAFDKAYSFIPGTDEAAIRAVFNEIPTQRTFAYVAFAYQKEYGSKLMDDLRGELEYYEQAEFFKIISSKPKA